MGKEEIFLLGIVVILPILSLIDLANDRSMQKQNMVWTFLIILIPFFGSVIYLIYSRYIFLSGTKAL